MSWSSYRRTMIREGGGGEDRHYAIRSVHILMAEHGRIILESRGEPDEAAQKRIADIEDEIEDWCERFDIPLWEMARRGGELLAEQERVVRESGYKSYTEYLICHDLDDMGKQQDDTPKILPYGIKELPKNGGSQRSQCRRRSSG